MIILHDNGHIMSFIMDNQKQALTSYVNYIEIDEVPQNKPIISEIILNQENLDYFKIVNGKLYKHPNELVIIKMDDDKASLRNDYTSSINTLQTIIDEQSFTNAKIILAIKDLAKILKIILKLFIRKVM